MATLDAGIAALLGTYVHEVSAALAALGDRPDAEATLFQEQEALIAQFSGAAAAEASPRADALISRVALLVAGMNDFGRAAELLQGLTAQTAEQMRVSFKRARIRSADADASIAAQVPAVQEQLRSDEAAGPLFGLGLDRASRRNQALPPRYGSSSAAEMQDDDGEDEMQDDDGEDDTAAPTLRAPELLNPELPYQMSINALTNRHPRDEQTALAALRAAIGSTDANKLAAVEHLLLLGASFQPSPGLLETEEPPLLMAVRSESFAGQLGIIAALLEHGADPDQRCRGVSANDILESKLGGLAGFLRAHRFEAHAEAR